MKNHITFLFPFLLLILISCTYKGKEFKKEDLTVKEGIGFNEIVLMKTRKSDIIKLYGDKFEQTDHNGSIEMNFKNQEISFYYDSFDKTQRIDFISFKNRFHGKTSKGLAIQSMTLNDVIRIYGNPFWRFSNEDKEITADYDDLGIDFNITKKVEINDSIPTSYFTGDIYINRMLLNYFKTVYGSDKIQECTIYVPHSGNDKRPFLGKSEIDSVFHINISKYPVGLLDNRIMAKIPEGTKVNEDDSDIEYEKHKQIFTVSLKDIHCVASKDMKSDIDNIIKSWKEKDTDFKLKEIINKKNISIYIIEPQKIKLDDEGDFMLKYAFIRNADNTILFVRFMINTNAWNNLKNYQSLSNEMIKSILPGSKRLNLKSEIVEIKSQQRKIVINKPTGFIFNLNNGPDFRVYNFVKLVHFNEPQTGMLIYIGNHPNLLYKQRNAKVVIVKKSGKLFGQKVEWNFCYKDKSQKFPYTLEGICKFNTNNDVHVTINICSTADAELFKKTLPDTEF